MISSIISRIVILVFGTLYPAYASYKAVKTKNIKEYLKWMMYWIVFALFTCIETFTDIFLSWFPFYYEIKILLVLWLLSPATKGSSILYRKFVHPMFSSREEEIDEYIAKAKEQSYKQVLDLGQKGVTALMQTALKSGGGIVNHIRKSYSLSDLSTQIDANNDETDDIITVINDPQLIRRRKPRSPMRSNSTSASVYFAEIDVATQRQESSSLGIRSIDDISSGYSSGEALYAANQPLKIQARESISSHRTASLSRSRSSRGTRSGATKKSNITSDDSDENEIFDTNIIFLNDKAKKIEKLEENISSSSSETEFFDIPDSSSNYYYNVHEDRIKPIFSYNTKLSLIENNNLKESDYLPNDNEVSAIFGYDGRTNKKNNEIIACKNTRFSSASLISVNLSKLSSALTSLYPSFSTRDEHLKNTDSENKIKEIKYSNNSINENKVFSNTVNGELEQKNRGGKYNKKHAPLPPSIKENLSENPIKAKLVLQPGVVRSLNSSTESLHKEIFLNYSPKVKRRSKINKSPTSRNLKNSDSSSVNKGDNNYAFSKMLQLPKKMPHLNLSSKVKENRNSWSEFLHTNKKLIDSRIGRNHSKSANSLLETNNKNNGQQILRSESELSVKNLTESSSMVNRRLRVIRRNL